MTRISDEDIISLKNEVRMRLSSKRFSHVLAVEELAAWLGEYILPDKINELRAAALLHDIAKELPVDENISLIKNSGFNITDEDIKTVGVLHSFSAPEIIKREFPLYADKEILSAVENHTVGKENMSVFDKIIFISDYAEATRIHESCKSVRCMLIDAISTLDEFGRLKALDNACIMAIEETKKAIINSGGLINSRMLLTEKFLKSNKL